MNRLVLLRHGESTWNRENRFTGWTDVPLTEHGAAEAVAAGRLLRREGYEFDLSATSVLQRAIKSLWLVLEELDLMWIPVQKSWRLNERHYGALQGANKTAAADPYGAAQVWQWRRGYECRPPALSPEDARHAARDRRYADLADDEIPRTESLADTLERLLPYWRGTLGPAVRAGQRLLIVSHGNTLRVLVKYLDGLADDAAAQFSIPTGVPLVYELAEDLSPVRSFYLHGTKEASPPATDTIRRVLKR